MGKLINIEFFINAEDGFDIGGGEYPAVPGKGDHISLHGTLYEVSERLWFVTANHHDLPGEMYVRIRLTRIDKAPA